jgi:hypothetical protein
MLAAAMRQCFGGRHVYVVVPNKEFYEYCIPILQDMGATGIWPTMRCVEFGTGCRMYFILPDNPKIVKGTFEVEGVHDSNTFWDHEAVRRKYNHILQRYHEYD